MTAFEPLAKKNWIEDSNLYNSMWKTQEKPFSLFNSKFVVLLT